MSFRRDWWKGLAVILLTYSILGAILFPVPALPILNESIRNLFFHVPMWFVMILLLGIGTYFSFRYLGSNNREHDRGAIETINVGLVFGLLGLLTGMIWAKITWGAWWVSDPRLNGAAVSLLIYLAYLVLRNSLEDPEQRARMAAIYSIFAYTMLIVFLLILPRLTDSLHPGAGGNPGFSTYDLDSSMRMVFYPAVAGWFLLSIWIVELRMRLSRIKDTLEQDS